MRSCFLLLNNHIIQLGVGFYFKHSLFIAYFIAFKCTIYYFKTFLIFFSNFFHARKICKQVVCGTEFKYSQQKIYL